MGLDKGLSTFYTVPELCNSYYSDSARYLVSDELFDLYGEGANLEIACQDYWLAVQDYLADLETDADRLAPYLAEQLANLRALLANETVL